jgi:hypothetical protein
MDIPDRYELKDNGERSSWETGSQRDTRGGKGRFDLIPPVALVRLSRIYEKGAVKYTDRNWEKGQPLSRYLDSALRHLTQWQLGEEDEDHLAQAAWNVFALLHTEELIRQGKLPAGLNDLPFRNE